MKSRCPRCGRGFTTYNGLGLHFWWNGRRNTICSPKERTKMADMKLWLYRTKDIDEDGDPIDHGVVKASTKKLAISLVTKRLKSIIDTTDSAGLDVKLYLLRDQPHAHVLEDVGSMEFRIAGERPPENPPRDAAGAASNRALLGTT